MTEQKGRRTDRAPAAVEGARYLGLGLTWAVSTGLFLVLGWFLDRWIGTLPLFTILGAFVGAGAGFYSMYHQLVVVPREEAARRKQEQSPPAPEPH